MSAGPLVERRRVTWPAGDPARAREAWGRDARAYARMKSRPSVVALVAALGPYLHRDYGHAWASDEELRSAMGVPYRSAVSRAIKIADEELGLIERETKGRVGGGGRYLGNERNIFPTRPVDMEEALRPIRERKPAPVFGRSSRAFDPMSDAEPVPVRRRGSTATAGEREFHRSPKPVSPKSEPKSERLGQDTGDVLLSRGEIETEDLSDFGESARRFAKRSALLVTTAEHASSLDFFLPTEELTEKILDLGRSLYRADCGARISPRDFIDAVDTLRDAAKRSWVEDDERLGKMFATFDRRICGASLKERVDE